MPDREIIPISDTAMPIKTYTVDSDERILDSSIHLHDELEIIFIVEGGMEFFVNKEKIIVNKGKIIIINSRVVHSSRKCVKGFTQMCLLQFLPNLLYSPIVTRYKYLIPFLYNDFFNYSLLDVSQSADYIQLSNLLLETAREFNNKAIAYDILIKSNLYRILFILYRNHIFDSHLFGKIDKHNVLLNRISIVLDYIEENYREQIKLQDVCELLKLNYYYFCRIFRQATTKTFVQYLNFIRVSEAERQLIVTDRSITDIAMDVGFSSASYFNRTFKRFKYESPSEYRRKLKEMPNAE